MAKLVLRELLKTVIRMNSKNCNAMKKIFTKMMLWAVAATALVSCENNFNDTTVNGDTNLVKVTLTADKPTVVSENRTELDNEGQPLWSVGDQIGAYAETGVDGEGKTTYGNYSLTNDNETEAAATTSFTGNTALVNTLYVYYPYVAGDAINTQGVVKANLLSTQTPTATSFDGKADIMIAKPVQLDAEGKSLSNLEFARLGAIVKVVLKDNTGSLAEEHLSSLTMTTANDIAGKVYLDAINQELGKLYDEGSRSKSVTANYTTATHFVVNGENAVYFVVYPTTLELGSTVSFTAQTENYKISKSIALPSEIALESGVVTTLNVSLAAEHIEEIETTNWVDNAYNLVLNTKDLAVGDQVVIVAADHDMAMGAQTNNNRSAVAVTKNANGINPTVDITNEVAILNIEEGSVAGTFAFQTSDNKYLYAAGSGSNYLKSQTTIDANASFAITIGENGVATVKATESSNRNWMRYNSTSTCFSCYSSGQQDICIYKLVGEYTMPPVLTVNVESITNISNEGKVVTFEYNVANPVEGTSVVITDDAEWLTTADNNGTVTVTVAENTLEEERNATITVKYGDLTKTIAVQQNAKPAEGGETTTACFEKVTSAPSDWSGTYLIVYETGKVAFDGSLATLDAVGNTKTVTISNNQIEATDAMKAIAFTIAKSGDANYSIKSASGKYLGSTGDANGLTDFTSAQNNTIAFASADDITIKGAGGAYLRYNFASNQARFRYYKSSSYTNQKAIQLYKLVGESGGEGGETPETPAPVLAVTSATTINVAAAGDVPTITYTITNPVEGQSVTASANQTWVHGFEVSSTDVTFYVDENTGAAREATVTLSYEGAENQTVTISQAAGNTGGGDEPATKVWTLVTDASTLQAGDQIIIAVNSKSATASATISSTYMNVITNTVFSSDNNTITTVGSGTAILTLGGTASAWTLTNESGKQLGTSAAKTVAWGSGTTTWTIAISNNNATIKCTNTTYGWLQYNASSPRFTTYTSSQTLPQIYRLQ